MRKITLFFVLALLCSVSVFAQEIDGPVDVPEEYIEMNGIYYRIINETDDLQKKVQVVGIEYYDKNLGEYVDIEYTGNIIIPSSFSYEGETYRVTSISGMAFWNCTNLTSVTIPESVTSIGYSAFSGCTSLISITIPDGVTSIERSTFYNCSSLTSITIPKNVATIGSSAFRGCSSLTSVTIPDGVTSIENSTFYNCSSLTSVTIPNRVTFIGEWAFSGCSGLTSIMIPEGVTSIEKYAFYNCSSLTSITIPNSVIAIGENAFSLCSNLTYNEYDNACYLGNNENPYVVLMYANNTTNGNIHEKTKFIYQGAFSGCRNLTSIVLSDKITSIESNTFSNCTSLTSITIGKSVTTISESAFKNCNLNKVNYTGTIADWCAIEFGTNPLHQIADFYLNDEIVTDIVIPDGITTIETWFRGCTSVESVTIPNSVTSISDYAFKDCDNLNKVNYTGTIADWCAIKFGANPLHQIADFYLNDEKVTDIAFPEDIGVVGDWFSGCTSVESVTIPESTKWIRENAFGNCSSLISVTIPDSVTKIGYSAFYNCSSLTSINIPQGITKIENYTFDGCVNLSKVIWNAKNCTDFTINNSPFYYYNRYSGNFDLRWQISSFTFGDSVQHIPAYLCAGMKNLTSVTIPKSVTSIGDYAFFECEGLTKTNYTGDIASWCAINFGSNPVSCSQNLFFNDIEAKDLVIPEGITSISNSAFSNCKGLTSVTIPQSITSIGNGAFYECTGLTKTNYTGTLDDWFAINFSATEPRYSNPTYYSHNLYLNDVEVKDMTIPEGVTTIYDSMFENWKGLTSITIPNSVTSIGNYAFRGCNELTSITIGSGVTNNSSWGDPLKGIFVGCTNLNSINWNVKTWNDYSSSSTLFYEKNSFDLRNQITSFTFGDSVEYIPAYLCYGLTNVESIKIPNSVTSMGKSAFQGCTKIRTLHIGDGMTEFPERAFYGCTGLLNLTIRNEMPPYVQSNTFQNVSKTLLVHVPCTSVGYYKAAYYWNEFTNYEESFLLDFLVKPADPEQGSTLIIQHPTCENITTIFKALPNNGYVFKQWNDGNTANPRTEYITGDVEYVAYFEKEGADDTEVSDVTVEATDNAAAFTWPTVENAVAYTLIIWANEAQTERVCTMTFDEEGRLTNIDFSASPKSQKSPSSVGLNFTVTGLTPNTTYLYDIIAQNAEGAVIDTKSGKFTTKGNSALEAIEIIEGIYAHDGGISGAEDLQIYNLVGQDVTHLNGALNNGVYLVKVGDKVQKVFVR